MRTPKEEREVLVSWYTTDDFCRVYTSDYVYMSRFDKLCKENPDTWECERVEYQDGDVVAKSYKVPVKCISFRREPAKGREMTEEEKTIAAERLRKARESKKNHDFLHAGV